MRNVSLFLGAASLLFIAGCDQKKPVVEHSSDVRFTKAIVRDMPAVHHAAKKHHVKKASKKEQRIRMYKKRKHHRERDGNLNR